MCTASLVLHQPCPNNNRARLPGFRQMSFNAPASATPVNLQATEEPRDCSQALGDDELTRLVNWRGDALLPQGLSFWDTGALTHITLA